MCRNMSIRRQENDKETMLGQIVSICEEMRNKQRFSYGRPFSHALRSRKVNQDKGIAYKYSNGKRLRRIFGNGILMRMASALKGKIYR